MSCMYVCMYVRMYVFVSNREVLISNTNKNSFVSNRKVLISNTKYSLVSNMVNHY
jgi:hypothetical protein